MISIYQLKPKFQALLKPMLKILHRLGVTANQITFGSVLLSLLIGVSFWYSEDVQILYLVLPLGLLLRMALNALDGMMARIYKQQSKKGELLNEFGDVVSDLFIYFPLVKYEHEIIYLIIVFICLSLLNEFTGLLGKVVSNERRYEGPMGKSDRAFIISIYGILAFASINISDFSFYIFSILNLLLILSTFTRLRKTQAKIKTETTLKK